LANGNLPDGQSMMWVVGGLQNIKSKLADLFERAESRKKE